MHNRKKAHVFLNTLIPFIINHEYIEIRSQKGVQIIIKIVESNFPNKINFNYRKRSQYNAALVTESTYNAMP